MINTASTGQIPQQYIPRPSQGVYGTGATYGGVPVANGGAAELSLRQLVEKYAVEHNIEFVPKVGRMYNGLQVQQSYIYIGSDYVLTFSGLILGPWLLSGVSGVPAQPVSRTPAFHAEAFHVCMPFSVVCFSSAFSCDTCVCCAIGCDHSRHNSAWGTPADPNNKSCHAVV